MYEKKRETTGSHEEGKRDLKDMRDIIRDSKKEGATTNRIPF